MEDFGADSDILRASQRISGHRATFANRYQPHPEALPHANICTKYGSCKVKILVFFDEVAEGEEVQRRDHQHQCGTWLLLSPMPVANIQEQSAESRGIG